MKRSERILISIGQYALCFVLVILGYILLLRFFHIVPLYENIDDFYLKLLSSGELTGEYETHLVYISFISGILLKALYSVAGNISWYGIWLWGYIIISLSSVLYAFLFQKSKSNYVKKIVAGIVFFFFYAAFLAVPTFFVQYTTVTIVVAGAAIISFYMDKEWLGVVLFILSFTIRIKASVMMLPVLAAFMLVKYLFDENRKKIMLSCLCILVGCCGIYIFEIAGYSSKEWRDFKAYNTARENIVDYNGYPKYEEYEDTYLSFGITVEAYTAAKTRYLLLLDEGFDAASMVALSKLTTKHANDRNIGIMIYDFVDRHIMSYADRPINLIVFVLYFIVFVVSLCRKNKKSFMYMLALFLGRMIVWGYLIYIGRYPTRITQGVYFVEGLVLLGIIIREKLLEFEKKHFTIMLCTGVVLAILGVGIKWGLPYTKSYALYSQSRMEFITSYEEIRNYFHQNSDSFYMLDTNSFLYFSEELVTHNKDTENNYVYLGCWTSNSPWTDRLASLKGIESYETLPFERENVYFVFMDTDVTGYDYLISYYESKYDNLSYDISDKFITSNGLEYIFVSLQQGE